MNWRQRLAFKKREFYRQLREVTQFLQANPGFSGTITVHSYDGSYYVVTQT